MSLQRFKDPSPHWFPQPPGSDEMCSRPLEPRGKRKVSYVLKLKQTTVDKARWLSIHFISPLCWPNWKSEGKEKRKSHTSHTRTDLTHSRTHLLCATDTYAATQKHAITYRELFRHTAPDTSSEMQRHSMQRQSYNIYTHRYLCAHSCHIPAHHPPHSPPFLFKNATPHAPSRPYTSPLCK